MQASKRSLPRGIMQRVLISAKISASGIGCVTQNLQEGVGFSILGDFILLKYPTWLIWVHCVCSPWCCSWRCIQEVRSLSSCRLAHWTWPAAQTGRSVFPWPGRGSYCPAPWQWRCLAGAVCPELWSYPGTTAKINVTEEVVTVQFEKCLKDFEGLVEVPWDAPRSLVVGPHSSCRCNVLAQSTSPPLLSVGKTIVRLLSGEFIKRTSLQIKQISRHMHEDTHLQLLRVHPSFGVILQEVLLK